MLRAMRTYTTHVCVYAAQHALAHALMDKRSIVYACITHNIHSRLGPIVSGDDPTDTEQGDLCLTTSSS